VTELLLGKEKLVARGGSQIQWKGKEDKLVGTTETSKTRGTKKPKSLLFREEK